jgi:hypothetical protein
MMTPASIIFMVLILGLYAGGFAFFMNKAFGAKK